MGDAALILINYAENDQEVAPIMRGERTRLPKVCADFGSLEAPVSEQSQQTCALFYLTPWPRRANTERG